MRTLILKPHTKATFYERNNTLRAVVFKIIGKVNFSKSKRPPPEVVA